MKCTSIALLASCLFVAPLLAEDEGRVLFSFDEENASGAWQPVNDGVMGGLSDGRFRITDEGWMEFYGTLSLENNGGFASVRSRRSTLGLKNGDTIVVRVRGDGRKYNINLYSSGPRYSYRQSFQTKKDEWIEVKFPVDKFVATWRGRVFRNEKFDPARANGIGFLLGDKKAGPFKLEIDWIKVAARD
jgi:monofunctional biosynthetic peptidoglycan transglycosylase